MRPGLTQARSKQASSKEWRLRNPPKSPGRKRTSRRPANASTDTLRARILIASSDLGSRKHLARLLSGRWSIATASSSPGVLRSANAWRPDLVLCDVNAGNDGIHLLRELRAKSATRDLPVIFLSGAHPKSLSAQALEQGAADYVRRPVLLRELEARINRQLAHARTVASAHKALARAEQSLRAKDEFIMQLSHEIRNPLNAVMEWVALLQSGRLKAHARSHAYALLASSARLQQRLVDDLHDAQRLDDGALSLACELRTGLGPVVKAVVDSCRPGATLKGLRLHTFVAANTGPVNVDIHRLQQALWNLLSNAIKFTPPGGSVVVRCFATQDTVEVQVTDTGAGITREVMPYIFDRFRRGTDLIDGLGLGLAIVKGIVELHGGSVSAASEGPGRGARFNLRLPLATAMSRSDTTVRHKTPAPPKTPALQILLAEDHIETARAIQRLLAGRGHQVRHARAVAEAVTLAEENPPDLLICDFNLKDGSGIELLSRVRRTCSNVEHCRLPAIVMSGYLDEAIRARAHAAGFSRHLEKPIDSQTLLEAVQQVFAEARWPAARIDRSRRVRTPCTPADCMRPDAHPSLNAAPS